MMSRGREDRMGCSVGFAGDVGSVCVGRRLQLVFCGSVRDQTEGLGLEGRRE